MRKSWLAVLLAAAAAYGGEVPIKYVNAHSFMVKVKPADEESRDAVAAELFISRFPENGWLPEGACAVKLENGGKVFTRTVSVPGDGGYFFTSRGVDQVGTAAPPLKGEAAQVKVIADTRAPKVEIIAPLKDTILRTGETVRLEWTAADENLALNPIDLFYSEDGENWKSIADRQPHSGHREWQVPSLQNPDLHGNGKIFLRINARDEAGNTGEALSAAPYKVMPLPAVAIDARPIDPAPAAESAPKAPAAADRYLSKDPRPASKNPQLDANDGEIPARAPNEGRTAYIAYVMGGNLVRQGRLKDSLRYFRSAVDIDPQFDEAWNDMALVYRQIGAFTKADSCIVKALKIDPDNSRYLNTRGLIYQSAGLDILRDPASGDESLARANDLILFAVKTYGAAVDSALRRGTLAERAETYFHLGEICYFANQDPAGARQYWLKVLELHTPTPELDEVMLDSQTPQEKLTRSIYEKNTELWVNLQTWQRWAREHLRQLNDLERGTALPRAPFSGVQFPPAGASGALGAGTAPQAASPESLTLLPDGSYAAAGVNNTQPGYVMMPQAPAASAAAPQVQIINNYPAPESSGGPENGGVNNVRINRNNGTVNIGGGSAAARADFPCPLCKIPGCRLNTHQPAIEAVLRQTAESAPVSSTRSTGRYYIENENNYHEVYHQENWGSRPDNARSLPASRPAPGYTLNRPDAPQGSRSLPANTGAGKWLQKNYGNTLGYTYETPRARTF